MGCTEAFRCSPRPVRHVPSCHPPRGPVALINMNGIHHIALRVNDCVVSARFYERVFGGHEMRRVESEGSIRAIWLRLGGTVLMLERSIRGAGLAEGSGHVLVFPTESLAEAERHLLELGVVITDRTPSTLFVQDPDGHRSGLSVYRFHETSS